MPNHRYQTVRKVTIVGAVVNAFLGTVKIIFGISGQSQALVADGVHSFSDLLTDALVIIASRFGSRKADIDHPYGHQRIETAATVLLALIVILAGFGIILDAGDQLYLHEVDHPAAYVLLIAALSVLANEALYHYSARQGKKVGSNLLVANAWHHRSDAASSIVVLIGVTGALLGFLYLDAVAAIVVGFMIIRTGWLLGWSSIRELIDTGVELDLLAQIKACILDIPGVQAIHQLRTRRMAENVLVDVHVLVDSYLSVSEGHYIAAQVHRVLEHDIPHVTDVTVHIDPENDEVAAPSHALPPREELLPQLQQCWQACPAHGQIEKIVIHYLNGNIYLDLYLPLSILTPNMNFNDIENKYQKAISCLNFVAEVKLYFCSR